ncbi:thiosulfate sulfurtransferase 16, chloroplastic-like [Olea europaea var. sylvestris]|uniref:thiosulfate sulfurtransferase 16, chloroplastic-like n=1 Tax=Olea europaea var. sylvestris TaxID=158386 RepID=UPI000C1D71B2|nr:thiosulfate sulfurtransferase 16, chloroplastic-like [Olea europaea var. sylvestris]
MRTLSISSTATSLPQNLPKHPNFRRASMSAKSQFRLHGQRTYVSGCRTPSSFSSTATAGENLQSTSVSVPTSVPVRVAHDLYLAGHRYLDVRTSEEFSNGHVPGAVNIPYMNKVVSGMTKNPNFLKEVQQHFGKDDEIIVGCQLGKRSLMAASVLVSAGFTGITDIAGGYAAWTQNGLPTES